MTRSMKFSLPCQGVAILVCLGLGGLSCSDDSGANNSTSNNTPKKSSNPTSTTKPAPTWDLQTVASNAGRFPTVARNADGSKVAVAYFSDDAVDDGSCEDFGIDGAKKKRWSVFFAERSGTNTWAEEVALEPLYVGIPQGLSLAFDASDTAHIATMTGDPVMEIKYCGANDAAVVSRAGGSWSSDVAVRTSGEAATGMPASDYGDVVGFWPSLVVQNSGDLALLYKDVHAGGLQGDDFKRADLELARKQGGSWSTTALDVGRGAGNTTSMVEDGDGRLVAGYYVPVQSNTMPAQGIWFQREVPGEEEWERLQVFNKAAPQGVSLVWHKEEKKLYGMFYESNKGYPKLLSLVDDTKFTSINDGWEQEDVGDGRYDEGYGASLAVSNTGRLAMTYYRCTKSTSTLGDCTPGDDALIFQWRDGSEWIREVVDEGEDGTCGQNPSLTFDSENRAIIAYQCETVKDNEVIPELRVAQRKALP